MDYCSRVTMHVITLGQRFSTYSLVDLHEKEVDGSDDKVAKLELLIGSVRARELHPQSFIFSFLTRMALWRDKVGTKSRELLRRF